MTRAAIVCLAALAALVPIPASACSWSYAPGYSPAEIRARGDVRRVHGTFRFDRARSDTNNDDLLDTGTVYGRIESETGRAWDTSHIFNEFAYECGMPQGPTGDIAGTFWITRARSSGRYVIRSWEPDPADRSPRAIH